MDNSQRNRQHSIYYNDDAQTVLQKYRLRRRGILFLYFLLSLAYIILMCVRTIFYDEIIWLLGFPLWFLFRYLCLWAAQLQLLPIMNILYKDCDPEKLYDVFSMMKLRNKNRDNMATFALYKAYLCIYIPERQAEGMALANQINYIKKVPLWEQMRLFCTACYAKINNNRELFAQLKGEFENLPNLYHFYKGSHKQQEEYLQRLRLAELTWEFPMERLFTEKFTADAFSLENNMEHSLTPALEEARALLSQFLSKPGNTTLRTVICHSYLARLDILSGKFQEAKEHLEYIVSHGGKLYLASQAREALDRLQNSNP